MTNSVDPDHLASEEANWSGSTLFAKAGYIWVQQDQGEEVNLIRKKNNILIKLMNPGTKTGTLSYMIKR